ncbi:MULTISPECIES: CARDB domain-containing protein [Haloferacaceae]|uniref:CARDB domain-containing protein n=1 Tax=Halorubrum glutamatedens TaxID=2707018 RepID=A0ABD5QUC9_9EURY|nr:CARDB domain-containing protein [Halobellus captivus]
MPTARRTAILAVLLVAAGSLAFATGAAVLDGEADTLADDRIAVQPADGPNGDYAYLNDDDEIAIDVSASNPNLRNSSFEGVNVDSRGTIDDVFTITYTADRSAEVWIEQDDAGEQGDGNLTFVHEDGSIENESNGVTLAPNESVSVGLRFDTHGAEAGGRLGADEFSIHANVTDPESETMTTADDDSDSSGPTVFVTGSGAERSLSASDVDGGDTVRFGTDGMPIDRSNVTLDGLELEGVSVERVEMTAGGSPEAFPDAGDLEAPRDPIPLGYLALAYDFDPESVGSMHLRFSIDRDALGDADPEDVTVFRRSDDGEADGDWEPRETAPLDEEVVEMRDLPADRVHFVATTDDFSTFAVAVHTDRIGVEEAEIADEALETGVGTTVTATVENAGGAAGERTLAFTADGETLESETASLAPGESTTVTFPVGFDEDGAYDLAVDGTSAGTLLVGDGTDSSDRGAQGGAGGGDRSDTGGDGSGNDAGESDSGSGASDDGSASPEADAPTEEPGGFGIPELAGVTGVLAVLLGWLAVIRRMPRS